MLQWILVIFIFLHTLRSSSSYPGGAPVRACSSMIPQHHAEPQSSRSPFSIKAEYLGNSVKVFIEDPDAKTPIRGFLLKAINDNGSDIAKGSFGSNALTHTLDCGVGSESALTHSSREDKPNITTSWFPPPGFNGPVVFRATIVKTAQTFWVGVMSNSVVINGVPTAEEKSTKGPNMPTSSVLPSTDLYSGCASTKGCFGLPRDCVVKRSCEVILTYTNVPNARYVHFQLVGALGAKSGWIAMGLSRNAKMGDDSVTECVLVRGQVLVRESWNVFKPKKGNFLLTGSMNITDEKGDYEDGVITCSWNRPYSTIANGITFDISVDKFYILLAKGPTDGSGQKLVHSLELPSAYPVNLTSASLVVGKLSTLVKIHGSFMTAAWIGFVSIGILLARHYKEVWTKYKLCGGKVWFAVHRCFMLLSIALIIAGFVSIFIDVNGWSEVGPNPHPILGCIAVGLAVLQVPDPSWQRTKIRIMYITDSYEKARQKAKQAEDTSDLQSTSEADVRRKSKKTHYSSSDDNDDPPSVSQKFPKLKKPTPYIVQPVSLNSSFTPALSSSPSQQPLQQGARNEIFQRKVFSLLENLTHEVKDIKVMLAKQNLPVLTKELPPECPILPLQSIEDLLEFEHFLEVEENLSHVSLFMSTTGGYTTRDCTRRILQKIISNPLSKKYNWKGSRGDKLAFSSLLHVNRLISDAVRSHVEFRTATDVEISNTVKKWLMHSNDRDGGRSYRKLDVNVMEDPFIAVCRPPPTSPKRPIFRWIHGLIGNAGQLIAVVNMFFAVSLKKSNVPQAFNWVLVTFLIFHCLVHLLIHIHSCFMVRERAQESTTKIHQMGFSDGYELNEEAPGSAFKKFALGLYSLVTIGLTVALILMICLN